MLSLKSELSRKLVFKTQHPQVKSTDENDISGNIEKYDRFGFKVCFKLKDNLNTDRYGKPLS